MDKSNEESWMKDNLNDSSVNKIGNKSNSLKDNQIMSGTRVPVSPDVLNNHKNYQLNSKSDNNNSRFTKNSNEVNLKFLHLTDKSQSSNNNELFD